MKIDSLRLVMLGMVLGSALTAALLFGLQLGGGGRASATQGGSYTGHFSVNGCTSSCVVTGGSNFTVDINLDTLPNPYKGISMDVVSTNGPCVSASAAAMAASWAGRFELSGCISGSEGEAAASKGVTDQGASQKGKIGEVVFTCNSSGTVSLDSTTFIVNAVTGNSDPVTFGNLVVTCNPSGPTSTPTFTPTPRPPTVTPGPGQGPRYTGHFSIGSCTSDCSVPGNKQFTVDINIDTWTSPYDGLSIDAISTTGNCKTASSAMAISWPGRFELSTCIGSYEGELAASKGVSDSSATQIGRVGYILFNCNDDGSISLDSSSFVVNSQSGNSDPITIPPLSVTCKGAFTATPTRTPTRTPTPTPVPPSQIAIEKYGIYRVPLSCYRVYDGGTLGYLFDVCDNDFRGPPAHNAVCQRGGVCDDEDPLPGSIKVTMPHGTYDVIEIQGPPNHTLDVRKLGCNISGGGNCDLVMFDAPLTTPWFPWDVTGDGSVHTDDITAVVNHYRQVVPR